MKALILAAGFGTRLEESYLNYRGPYKEKLKEWVAGKPKGLVIIKSKPVVQHQLEQLLQAGLVEKNIFIHTNALYYRQYQEWASSQGIPDGNVFNNGVYDHQHRRGAIGDLKLALSYIGRDDLLVLASDTLLFAEDGEILNMNGLISQYFKDRIGRMMVYKGRPERLSRHGIVEINSERLIIGFEEKPARPRSDLVNASVHIYTPEMIENILQLEVDSRDESGMLIKNLYLCHRIKAEYAAGRADIGTVEDVLAENLSWLPESGPEAVGGK